MPAAERSRVSVSDAEALVVLTVVPLTFQTYVSVVVSPSASDFVAVAVRVWSVVGAAGESETVAVGALLPTVPLSVAAAPSVEPSFGVTSTETVWPLSPLPACERSKVSVRLVVPEVVLHTTPLTFQT